MSKWIRKDDNVLVIAGNDNGKTGKVLSRKEDRVLVQGINIRKKHMKKTQQSQSSQIINVEMPIHISNVMPCDKDGKPVKLKVKINEKTKELVYQDNGKEVVYRTIKK